MNQITRVAIQYNHTVYSLPQPNRHHDVIRLIGGINGPDVQGFIDTYGNFLNRRQAFKVALAANQIKPRGPNDYSGDQLFSEDLW